MKVALEEVCCYGIDNNEEQRLSLRKEFEKLGLYNNNTPDTNDEIEILSWKYCLISSKQAYYDLEHHLENYLTHGPRFYATICLSNVLADMSDTLFYHPIIHSLDKRDNDNTSSTSSIYTEEDGDIMSSAMESLEFHCTNIKQQLVSVFTRPHLRRAKEILTWYGSQYRHAKVDLAKKVSVKKQRTLDVWIDNEHDNDDDDDAEMEEVKKDENKEAEEK